MRNTGFDALHKTTPVQYSHLFREPRVSVKTYLVEDSDVIRANLTETLQELAGVKVVGHADSAQEASRWLLGHPDDWDLGVIDLFLREGSGLAVLGALRQRKPSQRMIVVSNYATPEMRLRCRAAGADEVFDKSTEIEALLTYCVALAP